MKKKILGGLAVVVIWLGYTGFDYFTGNPLGGACQVNSDCKGNIYGKFGNQCLDLGNGTSFCTKTCSSDADCQAPNVCQEFDYQENGVSKGTNKVCAPTEQPATTAPAAAPGAVPVAQPAAVPPVAQPVAVPPAPPVR
jgi:hypothetical protein